MRTVLILVFLVFNYIATAQLIDPFGKVIVHEIKMNKLDDGTYVGAIEWTTGGIDSLQRFVVNGLDIKAPVMVTIISKAPDHTIDLSFHKKNWDKVESKVSTDGKKFVDKVFRTMNTAGLGVRSEIAGIPYLITVKVGLQFPSTKSLIRITDDKKEYAQHMRSMGYQGALFGGDSSTSSNKSSAITRSSDNDNSLMYIIIGLLAVIAILFAIFLMKRKSSQTMILLLCCIGFSQLAISQNSIPHNVPLTDMRPVFIGYQTHNVENQVPVTYGEPGLTPAQDRVAYVSNDGGETYAPIRLEPNQGAIELSGDEVAEIQRRMNEDREQFDRDYGEDSPGEDTEGDQRTLPVNRDNEELERLRRQVQRLQRQVDLLSQDDEGYEEDENEEAEILIYCEQIEACLDCMDKGFDDFATRYVYLQYLQDFYLSEISSITTQIAYGNSLASVPGAGLGWGPILRNTIMPAVNDLRRAYNTAFDEYIELLESDLETIRACYTGEHDAFPSMGGYEAQMFALINRLKTSRIVQ